MLVVARAIQGVGGGGIIQLVSLPKSSATCFLPLDKVNITISDIVPLKE